MSTTSITFRPDNHLASRLERLAGMTGHTKTHYLKKALRTCLDAFEKEALDQRRKEEKMENHEKINMTQRLAKFEAAQEICGLMGVIRLGLIREERMKEFPDQEKILQWEREEEGFDLERDALRFDDIEGQERIFKEYSPQVRAAFRKVKEPIYAAA
jgi:predicted transcriptional regulator